MKSLDENAFRITLNMRSVGKSMGDIIKHLHTLGYKTKSGKKLKTYTMYNSLRRWEKTSAGSTESVVAEAVNPIEKEITLAQGEIQNFIWKNMSNKSRTELLTQFVKNNS
jgi:hypothetical protein